MEAYRRAAHPDELLAGALPPLSQPKPAQQKQNKNLQKLTALNC